MNLNELHQVEAALVGLFGLGVVALRLLAVVIDEAQSVYVKVRDFKKK